MMHVVRKAAAGSGRIYCLLGHVIDQSEVKQRLATPAKTLPLSQEDKRSPRATSVYTDRCANGLDASSSRHPCVCQNFGLFGPGRKDTSMMMSIFWLSHPQGGHELFTLKPLLVHPSSLQGFAGWDVTVHISKADLPILSVCLSIYLSITYQSSIYQLSIYISLCHFYNISISLSSIFTHTNLFIIFSLLKISFGIEWGKNRRDSDNIWWDINTVCMCLDECGTPEVHYSGKK